MMMMLRGRKGTGKRMLIMVIMMVMIKRVCVCV